MTGVGVLLAIGLLSSCASSTAAPESTSVALGSSQSPSPTDDQGTDSADVVVPSSSPVAPLTLSPAPVVHTSAAAPAVKHTTQAPPAPRPTTHKPTPPASGLCGAPSNPDGYTYCTTGSLIYSPDSNTCDYFSCIDNFSNGKGYMEECKDGMVSMSGGRSGSCSYHDGNKQPVYKT